MADIITLTASPQRVTAAGVPYFSNPWAARDVSAYDAIDVEFSVVAWESPSSPSLTIRLLHGFQRETTTDWIASSSVVLNSSTPSVIQTLNWQLLRYMSWQVTAMSGATSAVLWIRGVIRQGGDANG